MGGGGGTNTVQKADPWEGLTPYLEGWSKFGGNFTGLFPEAQRLYQGGGPQYYPGSTIAGPSSQTLNAENNATILAGRSIGMDALDPAQGYLTNVLTGAYRANNPYTNVGSSVYQTPVTNGALWKDNPFASMDTLSQASNPYLSAMIDAASRDSTRNFNSAVMPSIASQFSAGGRYGSGAQVQGINDATYNLANKLTDSAAAIRGADYAQRLGLVGATQQQKMGLQANAWNTATNLAANAFGQERGFEQQAAGMLPSIGQMRNQLAWSDLGKLNAVGAQVDARNQANLNADIARWDYNQNLPWQNLGRYSQILQGWGGGQSSSSQSQQGSMLSNALGGAMLGNSLYGLGSAAGLWGGAAGLGALGGMGLGSGALLGGATGLATTGALGGVAGGTSLFSTFAPMMALAL